MNRPFQDGYDSVNMLKKIANPYIAGGRPIDWLQQTTRRMMNADVSLAGMNRELGTSAVSWQSNMLETEGDKAHRDLYHAWITSRMSKYTSSLMLKKTLADASFLGAALPATASDMLTFGGVHIDSEALQTDQEAWKEYQEFEKRCKEDLMGSGSSGQLVESSINEFNSVFTESQNGTNSTPNYNVGFPQTCGAREGEQDSFRANLSKIQRACNNAVSGYSSLAHTCLMQSDYQKPGKCATGTVDTFITRYQQFSDWCDSYCDRTYPAPEQSSERQQCKDNHEEATQGDAWEQDGWKVSNIEENVLAQVGNQTPWFPSVIKGEFDADGNLITRDIEGEQRVQGTVQSGLHFNPNFK